MNKIFKLAAAALVAVFFANSSIADNDGISIGVWGTKLDIDTYGTETQGGVVDDLDIVSNTQAKSVDVGSVFIELTGGYGSVGIEYYPGDATIGSGSRTDTMNDDDDGSTTSATYTASADVTDIWTAYVEPTLRLNDAFGIYGKLGLTTMYLKSIHSLSFGTDSTVYPNKDIWGAMYGIGLKATHSSGIFLKLEGNVTKFQHVKLNGTGGNTPSQIDADIDTEAVRLGIGYTF